MCQWITWAEARDASKSTRFPASKLRERRQMLTTKVTKESKVTKRPFGFRVLRDLRVLRGLIGALIVAGSIATVRAADSIPLIDAAKKADSGAIRSLLKQRVDVNEAAA